MLPKYFIGAPTIFHFIKQCHRATGQKCLQVFIVLRIFHLIINKFYILLRKIKFLNITKPQLRGLRSSKLFLDKLAFIAYNKDTVNDTKGVLKMTIETITAQLNRISADSYYTVKDNRIDLTIDDFEGFDDDWCEVDREFVDADAVEEVLQWLEENADCVDSNFYRHYHFGDIVVEVDYTSYDI
jgi:hypothetical protein